MAWVLTDFAAQLSARPARYFGLYALVTYTAMLAGRLVNLAILPYASHHAAFLGLACIVALVVVALVVLPEDQVCLFEESLRLSQEERAEGAVHRERCAAFAAAHGLTERETEVLELLAEGKSLSGVASELIIAEGTAKAHTRHIYEKLGINTRQELLDLLMAES